MPGLHGDEAWSGILAYSYSKKGIQSLFGMNHYTGILQPLSTYLSFQLFGTGIAQLRIMGIFFNTVGLILITRTLYQINKYSAVIFTLFITQSAIFLISPRIAWEVNTFTLFFLATSICTLKKLTSTKGGQKAFYTYCYFVISLLAVYNHIIFASVPLATLIALILWKNYCGEHAFAGLIPVLFINLVNCFTFYLINKYIGAVIGIEYLALIITGGIILLMEIKIIKKLPDNIVGFSLPSSPIIVLIILSVGSICFVIYHGLALFDILSNYKVMTSIYAYQPAYAFKVFYTACSCFIVSSTIYLLFQDIRSKGRASLPAFFILSYLAEFNLFTVNNSIRYYLVFYLLLTLYLAVKIAEHKILRKSFLISLSISVILSFFISTYILNLDTREYHNVKVLIGNKQEETSAHFLPKKNLADTLSKYQIGNIEYYSDRYFTEQPLLFYKIISPWKENSSNHAKIDYRGGSKGGFVIVISK
ncbi:hypothetical protein [Pedobacter sp. SG908]|uniref:hypothetical protein n=1 Tax=Pedobacter sp. SG908 TaxID=2587135 RepID=UPI00141E356E|nr:hypothetical protein [Pedobacter sp. SG908]